MLQSRKTTLQKVLNSNSLVPNWLVRKRRSSRLPIVNWRCRRSYALRRVYNFVKQRQCPPSRGAILLHAAGHRLAAAFLAPFPNRVRVSPADTISAEFMLIEVSEVQNRGFVAGVADCAGGQQLLSLGHWTIARSYD